MRPVWGAGGGGLRSGWGNLGQKVTSFVFHTKLGGKTTEFLNLEWVLRF